MVILMIERRLDTRKILNTNVRLYHPELGRLDGVTGDISEGGISIKLNKSDNLDLELKSKEDILFLRPINLDVLFPVSCLRQTKSNLVVKFLD